MMQSGRTLLYTFTFTGTRFKIVYKTFQILFINERLYQPINVPTDTDRIKIFVVTNAAVPTYSLISIMISMPEAALLWTLNLPHYDDVDVLRTNKNSMISSISMCF